MRIPVRAIRSHIIITWLVLLGLASPAAAAGARNPYDEFRDKTYSNKGLSSEQDEMRLGAQVHQQVLQKYRLVRDPEITDYVEQLGERIARASRRPNIPYHFYVIDDNSVNAFSLPGGYVYVNMGLLQLVQGEDELAAAMAHEVGHVVARHGLRNVKKAQRTAILFGVLGIGAEVATGGSAGGQMARAAAELFAAGVITKNSRDFEREADYLGLYNMTAMGYDPNGMVRVFQRLNQAASRAQNSSIGGIFADHPDSGERIRNTQTEIEQHLANAPRPANSGYGTARRRYAGAATGPATALASNSGDFGQMKAALNSYQRGAYQQQRGYRNNRNAQYDPNANAPVQNDRPVLRRRP